MFDARKKSADDDMWLVNELQVGPQPQTDVLNNHYFRLLLAILSSRFSSGRPINLQISRVEQIYCGRSWKRNQQRSQKRNFRNVRINYFILLLIQSQIADLSSLIEGGVNFEGCWEESESLVAVSDESDYQRDEYKLLDISC